MNNFTDIIYQKNIIYESNLSRGELDDYISKNGSKLPKVVRDVIKLTQIYNLLNKTELEQIRQSSTSELKLLMSKYNISLDDMNDLRRRLKELKSNIKLLPQYQTNQERNSLSKNKITPDDLTIDLDSTIGRNAATKMYMPLVYKIVNQYVGKSNLDKQELISAGLLGFNNALNDWKRDDDEQEKKVLFKTYASYRVKQQILNDINTYSHSLSGTNWYSNKKYGGEVLDAIRIDGMKKNDDGEWKSDRLMSLSDEPVYNLSRDERKEWDKLYKLIEKTFKVRDVEIFYRFFGLNNHKREKSKDIAKSFNMSEGNIRNSIINKMILFLKNNNNAKEILADIQDIYNESLMVEMVGMDREDIKENLLKDDTYILLEELNKWRFKNLSIKMIQSVLKKMNSKSADIIEGILLGDFNTLDDNFKKNKNTIIEFLKGVYPTENMYNKTDVSLLQYMSELQEIFQKTTKEGR